jgi:uncharacterized protein
MTSWRRWARWILRQARNLLIGLVMAVAVLWWFENRFVYYPANGPRDWSEPADFAKQDVTCKTPDGTAIHAWWCPKPGADGAILYAHGNGGNLSMRSGLYRDLQREQNLSILAFDYPGYGRSEGKPSEAGCYAAADSALEWLTTQGEVPAERVVLFGESLGGGVVVDLASRWPCRALVLYSTFSSLPDVGQDKLPFLPVKWLMTNRFESERKIRTISRPVFVAHGDADDLIPLKLARRLYDAAPGPKAMQIDAGRGHDLHLTLEFHAALRDFLKQHSPAL